MSGLPWIKVANDFVDDPKAVALANRLSDPRAPLHLPAVWGHFARHYAAGSMPDTEDAIRALERAALWGGSAGVLVAALVDVGLLDRKRGRLLVHKWSDWQMAHAAKLERDKERMRAKRAEARGKGRATVAEASRDGRAEEEIERRGDGDSRHARAKLGPLGSDLMAKVAAGLGSGLRPLADQEDADDLEQLLSDRYDGVADALAYVAQTCHERSRPGEPYVIRTQQLVVAMLRDVCPGTEAAGMAR